jgi:alkyl hydroperoxide reductase subunit AhpC
LLKVSANEYNYGEFPEWFKSTKLDTVREEFRTTLKVGDKAPDFEAMTLDGEKVRLSDFRGNAHVVLECGCSTCPPFVNSVKYAATSIEKLHNEYKNRGFQFFLLYVREAHPGELIGAHSSFEEKKMRAKELRDTEQMSVPILVDELDGPVHRAYGSRANSLFIINKDGLLVFKSEWADPLQVKDTLENLLEWERARAAGRGAYLSYTETLRAIDTDRWADLKIKKEVLHRAGLKSIKDWKEMLQDNDPI